MIKKENLWMSKANWGSFLVHSWIAVLGWIVAILPSIQEYMITDLGVDSSIAWAIIVILWVLLKKIVDKK